MKDEEILAGAPDEAESISVTGHYIKQDCGKTYFYHNASSEWVRTDMVILYCDSRSLADIKTIVELRKQIDYLHSELESKNQECYSRGKRIAELEKNLKMLERYNGSVESLVDSLEAHNLEQQSKGVEDFVERYCGTSIELEHEDIRACAAQQAKQLREGKK